MTIRSLLATTGVLLLTTACTGEPPNEPAQERGPYQEVASELNDATRALYVHIELLERLDDEGLEVSSEVSGGTAILSGTVRSEASRASAAEAALEVPGIDEVENRIEVAGLPEGEPRAGDLRQAALAARVQLAILEALAEDGLGVEVTVDGSTVVLQGSVPDEAAREEAAKTAEGVDGVAEVVDDLRLG